MLHTEVCALSGLLPTRACELRQMEVFIPGTVPTEEDNFYQIFEIDRETGLLADESTPESQRVEQVFIVLPQEARDWAARNGIRTPPDDAFVRIGEADEGVRLLAPDPYTIFEISPRTPPGTQRIKLSAGVPPETESVTYVLNTVDLVTVDEAPYEYWWPLEEGQHVLQARVMLEDGSEETSAAIPFAVQLWEPPQSYTVEE